MVLFPSSVKSFGSMAFRRTVINSFNYLFIDNKVRFASTETAVQKVTIRSMRRANKHKFNKTTDWFLLIIPSGAFALGTWQVYRKFQKEELNEEFFETISQSAVDLPKNLDALNDMEYRKVRVRGKFDHSKEIIFGPRAKIDELTEILPASLFSDFRPGYLIITPFKLSDRNLTILVNRGWVPADKRLASARPEGQITDEVEFVGLVRLSERRQPLGSKNIPDKNVWVIRDLNKMAEVTGAAPVFIDADKYSTVPGGPLGGQTIVGLTDNHLSYIFTWYGLAIISGYFWYCRQFKKLTFRV